MLQLLLEKGADYTVTNKKGKNPIDLANKAERTILKNYGACKSG